ncbi:helix-turn-helix transcriptional regulator [Methylobacterium sp. WL30]|uniref:helix-turn-helix domain-containing protein n=1 Tax=unclassified Methylobacterium TaxID=2615210 RepID=UPI0011C7B7EF|nr:MULTISPECIES: helix-turn-helix transcriptional regulator [unclassified Methylobacterium]MCJ2075967.1 helix-turn-helix domain-containing protein [Methylobacterium sp. E-016]TXM90481.1 helix-turn-helix transcriptional regulator [Methylobacterium sp. WL116]TXN34174.1 helix-turn-helix transcriptional regulator [Methylobacterium sp. WL93]TXN44220.1 helix-turn-helix transcriptional regulator [Methylobacterium sp. WL119]TXN66797.1 helix-turn-helix transcriptional regulator [Methylobacterium sp. WL
MNAHRFTTPAGERLVILSEADYTALTQAAEDAADQAAVAQFRLKFETGEEELIPAEVVDRLLGGDNRIRVWREHRGLTMAAQAGIAQPFLSQIETGKRDGTVETLRRIADALAVTLDDLVG